MNEDKATRYQRLRRRASLASVVWTAMILVAALAAGVNVSLTRAAEGLAAFAPAALSHWLSVAIVASALMVACEGGVTACAVYGVSVDRRYGMSGERTGKWAADRLQSRCLAWLVALAAVLALYACLRAFESWWWVPAAAVLALARITAAHLVPQWLLPLVSRVRPLQRESLRARLQALAERAGTRALDAYEWRSGGLARGQSALLGGLGAHRRIFISESMLADCSDDEIEVIAAHELGHHVHGDLWKGLAIEAALTGAALACAAWALHAWGAAFGVRQHADPAGLPLLLLALGVASIALRPVAHAASRSAEHRADRFALAMTQNPVALVAVLRRLSASRLAEEAPSTFVGWLFHSHPPARDRIAAARAFDRASVRVAASSSVG